MATPCYDQDDYHVAFICASDDEVAASVSMLDEQHASIPADSRSTTIYLLGRIGSHKVVILQLPVGHFGPITGTIVSRDLSRSFPRIEFAICIGTAGGAPSNEHDIRLGDVVVGTGMDGKGGIIRYDSILARMEGALYPIGDYIDPPLALLSILSVLSARDSYQDSPVNDYMEQALQQHPPLQSVFQRPVADTDRLFPHEHQHKGDIYTQCTSCSTEHMVGRPQRADLSPVVHHGLIAVGSQPLQDDLIRNTAANLLEVLCFATDAAGIYNSVPGLSIQGIANYCDSHANDQWKPYAALAAAACAKDVMLALPETPWSEPMLELLDKPCFDYRPTHTPKPLRDEPLLFESVDADIIDKATRSIAGALVSDIVISAMCSPTVLRFGPSNLQKALLAALSRSHTQSVTTKQSRTEQCVRWVVMNFRSLVATRMTEIVCAENRIESGLRQSGKKTAVRKEDKRHRTLRELVPPSLFWLEHEQNFLLRKTSGSPSNIHTADEIPARNSVDDGVEDQPDDRLLRDLKTLDHVQLSPDRIQQFQIALDRVLFPSIRDQLQSFRKNEQDVGCVITTTCRVDWELLQFIQSETISIDELDSLMTLNGQLDEACAQGLLAYFENTWGAGLYGLLGALKSAVDVTQRSALESVKRSIEVEGEAGELSLELFPKVADESTEYAVLRIEGRHKVTEWCLEALSWLATTLRPHIEGKLMISYIDVLPADSFEGKTKSLDYRLVLRRQEHLPTPDANVPGQCWTTLFLNGNLALGFPTPDRPRTMLGLEIPFEVMTAFSGVHYPLLHDGNLVLAGERHVLIPQIIDEQAVLWHGSTFQDLVKSRTGNALRPQSEILDITKLRDRRTFLGYSAQSEVVVGTADFQQAVVGPARSRRPGVSLFIKNEGVVGVTATAKGLVGGNVVAGWVLTRGMTARTQTTALSTDDLCRRASNSPAVLYDDDRCIAFLVPELSIAIQMVAIYLSNNTSLTAKDIPYAAIASNGGEAAYEAVARAYDVDVKRKVGPPAKYGEILREFLLLLDQRRGQRKVERGLSELIGKRSLRGWDWLDLLEQRWEFCQREIPLGTLSSRPSWWPLLAGTNAVVVLCTMSQNPLRARVQPDTQTCTTWNDLPREQHLLLANIAQLTQLTQAAREQGTREHPRYHMLTKSHAWARPSCSRLFRPECATGTRCTPVQTIRHAKAMRVDKAVWRTALSFHQRPGEQDDRGWQDGCVLFGDRPLLFQTKPCQIVHHSRTVNQKAETTLATEHTCSLEWRILLPEVVGIALFAWLLSYCHAILQEH